MAGFSIAKQSYRILYNVIVCTLACSLLRGLDKTWLFVTIGMCQFGSNKEHYFCSSPYTPQLYTIVPSICQYLIRSLTQVGRTV